MGQLFNYRFWCDVDQMMKTSKDEWHQLGNEIYITYIKKPHAGIRLSKQILKVSLCSDTRSF